MSFFVDTFINKVNSSMYQMLMAEGNEKEELAGKMEEAVRKEIEPLLSNAGPFFGGSKTMTLADVGRSLCPISPFADRSFRHSLLRSW